MNCQRLSIALGAALSLLAAAGAPAKEAGPALPSSTARRIDAFIEREMAAKRIPGLAFTVLKDGEVLLTRTFGYANLETGKTVRPASVFELASLTKPFTATAVMLLVGDGRVALDHPITEYIGEAPADWASITVRHLLTHTAGFAELVEPVFEGAALLDVSTRLQFDLIRREPRLFRPGESAQYSDPGYFLLGMIIEAAAGLPYAEFMERRVFRPLGLADTSVLDQTRIIPGRVAPYAIRRGRLQRGRRDWQHELPSHFGIFSTIEDMARWERALALGTLLPEAVLRQMWTPARQNDGSPALVNGLLYGLGWEVGDVQGRRTIGHGGFSGTSMQRYPEDGLTVIVLTNLDLASGNTPHMVARGVAGLIDPKYLPLHMIAPEADPDPATTEALRRFVAGFGTDAGLGDATPPLRRKILNMAEPVRRDLGAVWATTRSFVHVRTEDVRGRTLEKLGTPVALVVHVETRNDREARLFTFWLAADNRIADYSSYRH